MSGFDIRYDRRVSREFLGLFLDDGPFEFLRGVTQQVRFPADLQMRHSPKTSGDWASLYIGLTAVLNVVAHKKGLRLTTHKTWAQARHGWDSSWTKPASAEQWADRRGDVLLYLERVIPIATRGHGVTEGAVQNTVVRSAGRDRLMLDRETTPSFRNEKLKRQVIRECSAPILAALPKELKAGKVPTSLGTECDLLALEPQGRLLAIEVKPWDASGIAWVPAQAMMYAHVLRRWLESDGPKAVDIIRGMCEQRRRLFRGPEIEVPDSLSVVPAVALQRGAKSVYVERMQTVRSALVDAGLDEVEMHEVAMTGELTPL